MCATEQVCNLIKVQLDIIFEVSCFWFIESQIKPIEVIYNYKKCDSMPFGSLFENH